MACHCEFVHLFALGANRHAKTGVCWKLLSALQEIVCFVCLTERQAAKEGRISCRILNCQVQYFWKICLQWLTLKLRENSLKPACWYSIWSLDQGLNVHHLLHWFYRSLVDIIDSYWVIQDYQYLPVLLHVWGTTLQCILFYNMELYFWYISLCLIFIFLAGSSLQRVLFTWHSDPTLSIVSGGQV